MWYNPAIKISGGSEACSSFGFNFCWHAKCELNKTHPIPYKYSIGKIIIKNVLLIKRCISKKIITVSQQRHP
jgi:hypothetical protein